MKIISHMKPQRSEGRDIIFFKCYTEELSPLKRVEIGVHTVDYLVMSFINHNWLNKNSNM